MFKNNSRISVVSVLFTVATCIVIIYLTTLNDFNEADKNPQRINSSIAKKAFITNNKTEVPKNEYSESQIIIFSNSDKVISKEDHSKNSKRVIAFEKIQPTKNIRINEKLEGTISNDSVNPTERLKLLYSSVKNNTENIVLKNNIRKNKNNKASYQQHGFLNTYSQRIANELRKAPIDSLNFNTQVDNQNYKISKNIKITELTTPKTPTFSNDYKQKKSNWKSSVASKPSIIEIFN